MYKTSKFVSAYADEKESHPFRIHMERHTILALTDDIAGKSVLDIACGSGSYSRMFYEHGAKKIVGIDYSEEMIRNAIKNTPSNLPIDYIVADGENYRNSLKFDFVFHSYFLNYAKSLEALGEMCETISSNLNNNSYMLGLVSMLGNEPSGSITCCDFFTDYDGLLEEGSEYFIYFRDQDEYIKNYNWSKESYTKALFQAGLKNIQWHKPKYRKTELLSDEDWGELTAHNVFLAVTANKE